MSYIIFQACYFDPVDQFFRLEACYGDTGV